MTARQLVATLRARGVTLRAKGDKLRYDAAGGLPPGTRDALVALKPEILALLREEAEGGPRVRLNLFRFDRVVEVSVSWSDITIIVAPGCRIARDLRASDSRPGRIWCVCELADLVLSGVGPEDIRKVAQARVLFDGEPATVTVQ